MAGSSRAFLVRSLLSRLVDADDEDTARADETTDEAFTLRRVMERWDEPVIVTTAVRVFETLFANRPSKLRKLRRMARERRRAGRCPCRCS